jgi:hypothetical protein
MGLRPLFKQDSVKYLTQPQAEKVIIVRHRLVMLNLIQLPSNPAEPLFSNLTWHYIFWELNCFGLQGS